jgi:hypothetical protein
MNIVQQYPVPKQARSRLPLSCLSLSGLPLYEVPIDCDAGSLAHNADMEHRERSRCAAHRLRAIRRQRECPSSIEIEPDGIAWRRPDASTEGFVAFVCVQTNVDAGVSAGRINQQGLFCE